MDSLANARPRSVRRRRSTDIGVKVIAWIAAWIGIGVMGWIIVTAIRRGVQAWDWAFFTHLPTPVGEAGGGVANAIVGTIIMTVMATALGVPAGFFAGLYLAEFGRNGRFAGGMRLVTNVMMGIPSIIVGLFAYTILVAPLQHFSGYAGAIALAVIMVPVMARTTEDILTLVPNELRESALAAGAPRWRATLGVVVRAARSGLLTAAILAVVRVSGETAPLLFTALNNQFWTLNPNQPMANLTVTIYQSANTPFPELVEKAWGASLLIIVGVLAANLLVRVVVQRGKEW